MMFLSCVDFFNSRVFFFLLLLLLLFTDFFQNYFSLKILSGVLSECQTVWIQIRINMSNRLDPDQDRHFVGPDLCQNCLQRL